MSIAGAALGICARNIEVAQRHMSEIVRTRGVLEHPFRHKLGAAVGRSRPQRSVFTDRFACGTRVDRRPSRKR